ncbi:MAG: phosphatase PAP2 family protein, partial [Candidatus Liptonbacteria bacterium]|nr:phosphatase PAP2 family protein [Candidatus Liptonbacteria bacterium]
AAAMWWQNRAWGWWFFALALVNGAARVAAGVHWPLDIAGGAFVGIGGALLAHGLVGKYIKELKEKASPRLPA